MINIVKVHRTLLHCANFIVISLSMVLVTACLEQKYLNQHEPKMIVIGEFQADKKLILGNIKRIKVAQIDVMAPHKGTNLFNNAIKITTTDRYARNKYTPISSETFGAAYFLRDDFENYVREALNFVYEIDKNSRKSVSVNATIDISNVYYHDSWCSYWKNNTSVDFEVEIKSYGNPESKKQYISYVEDTYCTAGFNFWPPANAMAENIKKSLNLTTINLIQGVEW